MKKLDLLAEQLAEAQKELDGARQELQRQYDRINRLQVKEAECRAALDGYVSSRVERAGGGLALGLLPRVR